MCYGKNDDLVPPEPERHDPELDLEFAERQQYWENEAWENLGHRGYVFSNDNEPYPDVTDSDIMQALDGQGGLLTPDDIYARMDDITPHDIFKYVSGYYDNLHAHTVLFVSGDGITVMGNKFERIFDLSEIDLAFEYYRKALELQGKL